MKSVETSLAGFLEVLDAQLNDLPPARRVEILGETRLHLEAMIAARRADGMDENDAWRNTRDGFGDAEMVGRELAREWKRAPRVETVGTPLSKRARALKIAGFSALLLFVYPGFFVLTSWLGPRHLAGPLFLVLTPMILLFNIWRHHKKSLAFTPSVIFGMIFSFIVSMTLALKMQFADELGGTPINAAFDNWFAPVVIAICCISMVWMKQENKKVLPWRVGRRYSANPMAAEEEYRLNASLGIVAATAIPCFGSLWMGWQFFGMTYAIMICSGIVAFNYLVWRWMR